MQQVIINFKTDAKLKSEAKEVLGEMGLNFSIAFNAYLKRLILEKRIEFSIPEIPNARLRKAIRKARQEYKQGKTAGPFSSIEEMRKSLEV